MYLQGNQSILYPLVHRKYTFKGRLSRELQNETIHLMSAQLLLFATLLFIISHMSADYLLSKN